MGFIAGLLPLLSSAGVGGSALATAATVVPAIFGALDVASGIVQKDPSKIATGVISAATPGINSVSGLGSAADAVTSAPTSTAQVAGNTVSGLELGDLARRGLEAPMTAGKALQIPQISVPGAEAFLPVGKEMSLADKLSAGLSGAGAAASGVFSLINSLKGQKGSGSPHLGFGSLNTNLGPAGGVSVSNLPDIPNITVPGAGQVPKYQLPELPTNELMLELLQAYRA